MKFRRKKIQQQWFGKRPWRKMSQWGQRGHEQAIVSGGSTNGVSFHSSFHLRDSSVAFKEAS